MKKYAVLCACGLAAAMVFSGCGKKDDTKDTTPAQTEATSEAETSEDLEIKGDVKLGEYKNIEVTKQNTTVTDEELQTTVDSYIKANPDYVEVDRPAKEGDTVNIDYVGMKDGVAFEGGTAEGQDLTLGSGSMIDGFEDGLVGAKKGETKTLNLTFPEDYANTELAGQAVTFDVTVNAVKEEQPAELNDEFVQKMNPDSDITTVEQYRESIRTSMQESLDSQALIQKQNDVLEAVISNCQFSDIDARVEQEFQDQWEQINNMAAIYGMDIEMYAAMSGATSVDEFQEMVKEDVSNGIKLELMMNAVAEAEGITLTDQDYAELAESNGAESADELIEQYGAEMVDEAALQIKVMNFLTDNAVEV